MRIIAPHDVRADAWRERKYVDSLSILWFRRDLRLADHPALAAALAGSAAVLPVFVFDDDLLANGRPAPNRTWFMHGSVAALAGEIAARGGRLWTARGSARAILPALARSAGAVAVHVTADHAPFGRARDDAVRSALAADGIAFHASPGLYVHEPDAVLTAAGAPFTVYSPFRRAWSALERRPVLPSPARIPTPTALPPAATQAVPNLHAGVPSERDLGLPHPTADASALLEPGEPAARRRLERWLDDRIDRYAARRDRLDLAGTSRLSQDLRWGLLSPLEVVARAEGPGDGRRTFVGEVAWRDFYAHVLRHHPRVLHEPFRAEMAAIPWRDDPDGLDAWTHGRTGYPTVDAAMRELRATGFMPNRARMIAASFLAKHLLVNPRAGERVFMDHLVDADVASNDGGWQWTASTGTDPQPYFRVFNPVLQGRTHDPEGRWVTRWLPELARVPREHIHAPWELPLAVQHAAGCVIGRDYPAPIVDHGFARARALAAFASVTTGGASRPRAERG